MLLVNPAAGKLIIIHEHVHTGRYYDIMPTSELPGEPCPVEADISTDEEFIVHYYMPMFPEMERDTIVCSHFTRGYIRPEDVTHVAISLESLTPQLIAIKFRGHWFECEP